MENVTQQIRAAVEQKKIAEKKKIESEKRS
jgi:hypothetical protein